MPPAPGDPGRRATVTPLRRPPVRQAVVVRASQRRTFEVFVRTIAAWWPAQPFSSGKGQVREVTVERRAGGRVFRQGSLDKVRELQNGGPGVRQGLYRFDVMTWRTPAGRITFPAPGQISPLPEKDARPSG